MNENRTARAVALKPRVVAYVRQSLDAKDDRAAVDRQLAAIRAHCKNRGWPIVLVIEDNSVSAFSGKARPGWNRVLEALRTNVADMVVAWSMDRIVRRIRDLEDLIDLCQETGAQIATVTGEYDLTSDQGRLVARLLASVARAEGERKGERQRLASAQRAEQGISNSCMKVVGYEKDGNSFRIIESEAQHVRDACESLLEGVSLAEICRTWNAAGLITARGNAWTSQSLSKALRMPRYAGLLARHGEVVGLGNWPAIISVATHEAVVAMLNDPARQTGPGGRVVNLLTAIAYCAVCDRQTVNSTKSVTGEARYSCVKGCVFIGKHDANALIGAAVVARLSQPDAHLLITQGARGDVRELAAEATALRRRLDVLVSTFAEGSISDTALRTGSAKIRALLAVTNERLAEASDHGALAPLISSENIPKAWAALTVDRQRAVLQAIPGFSVTLHPLGKGTNWSTERVAEFVKPTFVPLDQISVSA